MLDGVLFGALLCFLRACLLVSTNDGISRELGRGFVEKAAN